MFDKMTSIHSDALDDILKARRSVRMFGEMQPDKRDINQIIQAGLIAPFASIPAKGKTDFRKIIVIPATSSAMTKVEISIRDKMPKLFDELGSSPLAINKDKPFEIATLLFGNAPYLIIGAERKGMPSTYMADQSISLSYCMYNMWLKAISLKIGFKLVSAIVHLKLGNDKEFCTLLGIPIGEYALDACVIGYPTDSYKLPNVNYPEFSSNVTWL